MVGPLYNHVAGFIYVKSKMERDARKYNQELETNDDETADQFQGVLGSILWFDFVSQEKNCIPTLRCFSYPRLPLIRHPLGVETPANIIAHANWGAPAVLLIPITLDHMAQ